MEAGLGREESNGTNAWRRVDALLATGLPCTLSKNAETRDAELDQWRLTSTPQNQAAKHTYLQYLILNRVVVVYGGGPWH